MLDVLICGAGATGLTLAIELQRRGVHYRLIDPVTEPFGGSRGKGVQPRSLEIFDMMGVVEDVMRDSSLYQPLKLHFGPITKTINSLGTAHEPTEDKPYPNMHMVPQWRTEQALRARLEELGGRIEWGIALEGLEQHSDKVSAKLSDGSVVVCQYLVGCDGGRSTTRKALGVPLIGETLDDKTMIVADFELEGLDRSTWHVFPLKKGGPIAFAPLPQENMWQLQGHERIARNGLEEGIAKLLKKRPSKIVWQSRFKHQRRMVEKYRVGNVFLAGDAAHLHPPSGAQGLNTGIQDAFNLGWKLAAAIKSGDASILDTYEAERLPIAADMLDLTSSLHTAGSTKRGELTNQLSVGYRGGPLAEGSDLDAPEGSLQAGDRMPDEVLADGTRLLVAMRHGGGTRVRRPNGASVLVRPDGYIASIRTDDRTDYYGLPIIDVRARG